MLGACREHEKQGIGRYTIILKDIFGKVVDMHNGTSNRFNETITKMLKPGIYFIYVEYENSMKEEIHKVQS